MGYRTVKQVPHFRTYDEAHHWWENTKPIRGRDTEIRPLAERRYADCYSIRKDPKDGAIECVLYQTPVVTFMPDGGIQITNGGYATASTHMFIREVLGYSVRDIRRVRGQTVGTVNGQVFAMAKGEVLRLKRDEEGKLRLLKPQTHYGYRIKRKAANNVRARYKEFRDYLSGFIKLRAQEKMVGQLYPQMYIGCAFSELEQVYEVYEWRNGGMTYRNLSTDKYNLLHEQPWVSSEGYEKKYTDTMQMFTGWITDQSDDKHNSFYKATLLLCGYQRRMMIGGNEDSVMWIDPDTVLKLMDTALLKWHADEVLERYELPPGKQPTSKYMGWVRGENT